ncbi:unnamed protein product [Allacma fusca]|uniref:Uncharacterized protein n=1 Tax=Allacma fusca TaxID=39272 RepID=A0A8J2JZV8_9HEXA|nr:unnamed protein product [Allacma fusca]
MEFCKECNCDVDSLMDHIYVVHTDYTEFFLDDPFKDKEGKVCQRHSKKDEGDLYAASKHTKYVKKMAVVRRSVKRLQNYYHGMSKDLFT